MTPSLPTFSMASAMILPMTGSLLAEMVATFWMSGLPFTGLLSLAIEPTAASTACRMPRTKALASTPAVT